MIIASHAAVTGDGAVKAAPGALVAALLTGGSEASTLTLYDNASAASGTVLATLKAAAGATVTWTPVTPYTFVNGCYADVGGSGAAATVVYT